MDSCIQGSICFELMKGIPAAFVTLIIGGIAGAITWRQYQVAKAKLKLDLFEKRYAIFQKAWLGIEDTSASVLKVADGRGWPTPFNVLLPEALFLFGKEIEDYLNELSALWIELLKTAKYLPISAEDDAKNTARKEEILAYFIEQVKQGAKAKFGVYLGFENWK
jgi:hypothetical protein